MNGNWNFAKESTASPNDLDLKTRPSCIRPETHWAQEVERQGRPDDRLWFSLRLPVDDAEELCDAFAGSDLSGRFGELITGGTLMAPASYAALRFAIAAARDNGETKPDSMQQTLGTDLLVPPAAYDALRQLVDYGTLEITDAGLALEGTLDTIALDPNVVPQSAVPKCAIPRSPIIIAIIDDGIGVANHRFRKAPTETRVEHFLDLSLAGTPSAGGARDELLGRSWTADEINPLLAQYPDDEECVYRALGLIGTNPAVPQPLRAAVSHGTHMLDTAAGYDWRAGQGEAANRLIIAVQPPLQAAENRSEPWMPLALKRALDWILVKADELSARLSPDQKRLPLIVNCSFSRMAGPQDGWSDVERRITQFVRTYRGGGVPELCTVIMSAGNTLQLRAVARVRIDKDPMSLPWRVLPDDKTPSFVQLWLSPRPENAPQQVRVALRPPGQTTPGMFSVLDRALEWTVGGDVRARLYHQSWSRSENERRESVTIAIRATNDDGAPQPKPVVPAGLWYIDIEPTAALQGPLDIDLHVQRDDVGIFGRGKGRQSYFDDPDYRQVELAGKRPAADGAAPLPPGRHASVRQEGTLNTYGYGDEIVLAAGYRYSDGKAAAYSASGAEGTQRLSKGPNQENMEGPDLAAVTEESPSLPGILATGTYSGSVVTLNGTSVAAPLTVRALAAEIAAGGSLATLKTKIAAAESSGSVPYKDYEKLESPPLRRGVGRLPFKSSYRLRT